MSRVDLTEFISRDIEGQARGAPARFFLKLHNHNAEELHANPDRMHGPNAGEFGVFRMDNFLL
jgi:hypothetical protein